MDASPSSPPSLIAGPVARTVYISQFTEPVSWLEWLWRGRADGEAEFASYRKIGQAAPRAWSHREMAGFS